MVSKVRSLGLQGIGGYEVSVECFLSNGLPSFDVVGLPDAAVKEARDRVRAAIKNCGLKFPVSRLTVNLAPADTRKAGTIYDLPMALGILVCTGQLKPCLSFDSTTDLRALLRDGSSDEELKTALEQAIFRKPRAHSFERREEMTERRTMSQIGG